LGLLLLQLVECGKPGVQEIPTVIALRDGFSERVDDEVFQIVVPYGNRGNGLELIPEVLCIDDSAIDGDNKVVLLDEYRIVVAFPVQDLVTGRVLQRVVALGIVGFRGVPFEKFSAQSSSDFFPATRLK
jgi:hypothetical protein